MIRNFLFFCLFLILTACQNNRQSGNAPDTSTSSEILGKIEVKPYRTSSGMEFLVSIDRSRGASINEVSIQCQNFQNRNENHKLGAIDPIQKIWITDLDSNGFEELVIITTSAGSGSYGNIYGLASNKDKSATPIYIRPLKALEKKYPELKDAYRGHDLITLSAGQITRTFPLYEKTEPNSQPSGNSVQIVYKLVAGEAGWILEPDELSIHKNQSLQQFGHPQQGY